jgi:hypothetical protein
MSTVTIDPITMSLWELQGMNDVEGLWSRGDIETIVERVNKGAELLDNYEGTGWTERIMPGKLDMSSGSFCIIGQAYNGYDTGLAIPFGIDALDEDEHPKEVAAKAVEHGFLTEVDDEPIPFKLLDRVWVYMLEARKESPGDRVSLSTPGPVARNEMITMLSAKNLLGEAGGTLA